MMQNFTPKNLGTSEGITRFLMVVDSDARDLFYTSMLLQRFEYSICTARTADEALEMIMVAKPALIITELSLTGMSVLNFIQRLRQDSQTAAIPLVIQTSDLSPETQKKCSEAGASFSRKPVQVEELFRTVQLAIENRPRNSFRIYTRLPITANNLALHCGKNGECLTTLSEDGMYVWTLKPSPVNARIVMQLELKDRTIFLEAIVLRSHGYGEGPFGEPGMGLRFVEITPEDKACIRQFITEEVTKGIKVI
jgi:CheY-like chemotaxis protein